MVSIGLEKMAYLFIILLASNLSKKLPTDSLLQNSKGGTLSTRPLVSQGAVNILGENGGVLVCADVAARGLDIPNVSHVIQAEFATSAVDFLHRIGHMARVGQSGIVTSCLVNGIKLL